MEDFEIVQGMASHVCCGLRGCSCYGPSTTSTIQQNNVGSIDHRIVPND